MLGPVWFGSAIPADLNLLGEQGSRWHPSCLCLSAVVYSTAQHRRDWVEQCCLIVSEVYIDLPSTFFLQDTYRVSAQRGDQLSDSLRLPSLPGDHEVKEPSFISGLDSMSCEITEIKANARYIRSNTEKDRDPDRTSESYNLLNKQVCRVISLMWSFSLSFHFKPVGSHYVNVMSWLWSAFYYTATTLLQPCSDQRSMQTVMEFWPQKTAE